jgi:cytochrome b subunit of formate dehydrogenase
MLKKTIITTVLLLVVIAATITWVMHVHGVLFHTAWAGLIAVVVAGAAAGIVQAAWNRKKQAAVNQDMPRHTVASFLEHWGAGAGIIILIVSGAMLASGSRVGFIFVPEFARSRIAALNLHYLGVFFTLLFGCLFLVDFLASGGYKELFPGPAEIWDGTVKRFLLRKKWHDKGKYEVTQKLAFLVFAVLGAVILVTGVTKIAYFIFQIPLNRTAGAHDIASELFVIMLIVHILFVIAVPSHWRLLRSWFTGREVNKR